MLKKETFSQLIFFFKYMICHVNVQLFRQKSVKFASLCALFSWFFCWWFFNWVIYDLFHKYENISQKSFKPVFFQDWFPNYRIYCVLFPMFELFSLLVFEIWIILRDATKVRIYSTYNLKFSCIFLRPVLWYIFLKIYLFYFF